MSEAQRVVDGGVIPLTPGETLEQYAVQLTTAGTGAPVYPCAGVVFTVTARRDYTAPPLVTWTAGNALLAVDTNTGRITFPAPADATLALDEPRDYVCALTGRWPSGESHELLRWTWRVRGAVAPLGGAGSPPPNPQTTFTVPVAVPPVGTLAAPANVLAPVASAPAGATLGAMLACAVGTWTGTAPAFAYQWRRNGVVIAGATGDLYVVTGADLGATITCTVTASNALGSASATSNALVVLPARFAADFTGGALPAGIGFARAGSGYSVRTGTNTWTVGGALAASDTPRWGRKADTDPVGLVLEEARTQHLLASDLALAPWATHSGTIVADGAAPPMGGTSYQTTVSGGQLGRLYYGVPALVAGTRYAVSIHAQGVTNGESHQLVFCNAGLNAGRAVGATLTTSWTRPQTSLIAGTDTSGDVSACFVASNYGVAGNGVTNIAGGVAANARGGRVAAAQVEAGGFATELIPSTAAQVTRNGERLFVQAGSAAAFSSGGTHTFVVTCEAKGASAGYVTGDAYLWRVDANNHARLLAGTAQLVLTLGGVAYTCGGAPAWGVEDLLEFALTCGTAGVRAVLRVNGGSPYLLSLGSAVAHSTSPTIAGAMDILCNGTAGQFSARVRRVENIAPTWAAFSTAPDWRTSLDGWNDTGRATQKVGYLTPHGWAHVAVLTDASTATFEFYSDDTAPGFEAAIEVQDVTSNTWVRVLATTNAAINRISAALPGSGLRLLRIYPGTLRASLGSWPMRIVTHDGTTCVTQPPAASPATRLIILGDSIPEQIASGVCARDNAIGQLRALLSATRVTYVGTGGDALSGHYQDFAGLGREVIAAASDVAPGGAVKVYVQWGYNDYNNGWPSSAAYLTQLQNLLTNLRAWLPAARVYLQTLGTTTNTGPNINGLTAAGWRAAQAGQFNAWGDGNSALVDGAAAYATDALSDGVHLTTSGSTTYAASLRAAAGVT